MASQTFILQRQAVILSTPNSLAASLAGLHVVEVELVDTGASKTLLVERFDRVKTDAGWTRRGMISALTVLGLDEMIARYASYEDLVGKGTCRLLRDPQGTAREVFGRLCFNILSGNTDDHARNHAFFWDGKALELTPAYDICPQLRTGNEASQAMAIKDGQRMSKLRSCLDAAEVFGLSEDEAAEIVEHQLRQIGAHWEAVTDKARLPAKDKHMLATRQFLNTFCIEDCDHPGILDAFHDTRDRIVTAEPPSYRSDCLAVFTIPLGL